MKPREVLGVMFSLVTLLACTGCVVPLGSKVTSGQRYSAEALEFLDLPGTAREEVIATLGEPTYDFPERRTIVYVWEQAFKAWVLPVHGMSSDGVNLEKPQVQTDPSTSKRQGLFITFSERGTVVAHTVRSLEKQSAEDACSDWNKHVGLKP